GSGYSRASSGFPHSMICIARIPAPPFPGNPMIQASPRLFSLTQGIHQPLHPRRSRTSHGHAQGLGHEHTCRSWRSAIDAAQRGRRPCSRLIMDEPRIRAATVADVSAITEIVGQAYRLYIARIGKPPGPMLDDYAARVLEGVVWVLEEGGAIAGIIVLLLMTNYLLLDNVAVSPARQGLGLGRRLLAFAEAEALRRGYHEIRLYTHQTMVENQSLYASVGYEETGRGAEAGYDRVFMRKQPID